MSLKMFLLISLYLLMGLFVLLFNYDANGGHQVTYVKYEGERKYTSFSLYLCHLGKAEEI